MPSSWPVQAQGICATCIYSGRCLFNHASCYPVWYCDHFDTEVEIAAARAPLVKHHPSRLKPVASDKWAWKIQ